MKRMLVVLAVVVACLVVVPGAGAKPRAVGAGPWGNPQWIVGDKHAMLRALTLYKMEWWSPLSRDNGMEFITPPRGFNADKKSWGEPAQQLAMFLTAAYGDFPQTGSYRGPHGMVAGVSGELHLWLAPFRALTDAQVAAMFRPPIVSLRNTHAVP